MNKQWILTQESFDALLDWLDPSRDVAGQKYETIRARLIKIFVCRGCLEPEDLADETINRVTSKLKDVAGTYTGEPALYFYGVANKVHLEYLRRKPVPPLPAPRSDTLEVELAHQCLDRCAERLSPDNRYLMWKYYEEEKQAKIETRKLLADELGIALNALRIRAHRIRLTLEQCVTDCLERAAC